MGFGMEGLVAAFVGKGDCGLVEMVVNNLPQWLELARKEMEAQAAESAQGRVR
jgi:hypothetical protein